MQKILSSDILIADIMIPLPQDLDGVSPHLRPQYKNVATVLDNILQKKNVRRGQKVALSEEEFRTLSEAVSGLPTNGTEPGGSAANTLTTLKKLLGDAVAIDFMGVTGQDMHDHIINRGLKDAGVNLVAMTHPDGKAPKSALSFVFTEADGKRTIATYPGNNREFFPPRRVTQELKLPEHDIVFVQGSLWEKTDKGSGRKNSPDEFGLPDKMVAERWNQNKEIWLALPTHAKFSDSMTTDNYRFLIPSADVVLGNQEELMRIYETTDFNYAITRLQHDIAERDKYKNREGKTSKKTAVAFITRGKEGATVVTPHSRDDVPVARIDGTRIYELGAGDTAYAGFLAGHLADLTPKQSAQLAMELAAGKLKYNSARIPDPGREMHRRSEESFATQSLWNEVKRGLSAERNRRTASGTL
ncbi:MAG: carbohydrate kinase family protein [Pseudomonadota bacterium]|nr:carbohydrate kinase family protein [Pseudomonadota bacterium]